MSARQEELQTRFGPILRSVAQGDPELMERRRRTAVQRYERAEEIRRGLRRPPRRRRHMEEGSV